MQKIINRFFNILLNKEQQQKSIKVIDAIGHDTIIPIQRKYGYRQPGVCFNEDGVCEDDHCRCGK